MSQDCYYIRIDAERPNRSKSTLVAFGAFNILSFAAVVLKSPRTRSREWSQVGLRARTFAVNATPASSGEKEQPYRDMCSLLVLYGSQTGTARSVAEKIGRLGFRLRIPRIRVMSFADHFERRSELLPQTVSSLTSTKRGTPGLFLVCVCATTGHGEVPDNMKKYWRFLLQKQLPSNTLSGSPGEHRCAPAQFGVFGLGDSTYPKYNHAARKLHCRLLQLGGDCVVDLGLADDQHPNGIDGTLTPWLDTLRSALLHYCPLPEGQDPLPERMLLPPQVAVVKGESDQLSDAPVGTQAKYGFDNPFPSTVVINKRLTSADHFQNCRHLELDISGSGFDFAPGDVAVVLPQNSDASVDFILEWLGLESSLPVRLEANNLDANVLLPSRLVGTTVTLRRLLQHYLDISAVPRRYFFEILSHFAKDHVQKERLKEFATTREGLDDLHDYCFRPRRTPLEIIQEFDSTRHNVPFKYLFELFPLLQPRHFSISNSLKTHANSVHLTVAVVKYQTYIVTPRLGLCSNFLASLAPGSKVDLWIRKGALTLPPPSTPLIMIGPGTGVAPFRAVIHQRVQAHSAPNLLVFGNRNVDHDFLYSDEWEALVQMGQLKLITAFSRDQPQKRYVQHAMNETDNAKMIFDLLVQQSGTVMLAGSAKKMPEDVEACLAEILRRESVPPMSAANASKYLKGMESSQRLQRETWS